MKANKNINIRCTEEQLTEIKRRANELNLSQAEYILMKTLDLVPVKVDEIKEYPHRVGKHEYTLRRLVTKTILKPIEETPPPASPVPAEVTA